MGKRRSKGEGSIFFDKRGYWVAEITLAGGKEKRKYSKSQKIVREWLLEARKASKDGILVEADKITASEFFDRYMKDVAAHTLRPKTLESYSYLFRLHIQPEIGSIPLALLRPDHVQSLYSRKLEAGLSRRTVRYIHSVIHKSLRVAMKWGLVVRNVADLVDAPPSHRPDPVVWTFEDVQKFLKSVKGHRFYPIYVLAVTTGMREGEILGLHFEDVNWETNTIHVHHAVLPLVGKGLVITEPKTDKAKRSIRVPKLAIGVLRQYVEQQNRKQGLMFVTSTGHPFSPRNLVRHFKQVIQDTGLPEIRFHDLRHTCATLLLTQNVHPKAVQEILGHSQISLTMDTYSHVLPTIQDEAAEKMDQLFGVG